MLEIKRKDSNPIDYKESIRRLEVENEALLSEIDILRTGFNRTVSEMNQYCMTLEGEMKEIRTALKIQETMLKLMVDTLTQRSGNVTAPTSTQELPSTDSQFLNATISPNESSGMQLLNGIFGMPIDPIFPSQSVSVADNRNVTETLEQLASLLKW
jgi:hypothetical protein